jgi:ABC-type nitrate/sulfonate/bicarbonate transport system substrate-binding protein
MWKSILASKVIVLVSSGFVIVVSLFVFNWLKLEPVRVALPWLHQAQFAGMYVANAKGFYKNEGVSVHLIERDSGGSLVVDLLSEGKADIAIISPGEFLRAASNGKDIVALAAVFQMTPTVILSLEKTDIKSPKDLEGKKVGLPRVTEESKLLVYALLEEEQIPKTSVTFSEVGDNQIDALLRGDVDAVSIHRTNELYELEVKGIPYSLIFPERFGVDMYGDIIVVSNAYLLSHKKEIGGFLKATFKGWEFAEKDPHEATQITLEVDNPKYHDAKREEYILKNALKMVRQYPKQTIGQMIPVHWDYMYKLFQRQGIVNDTELENFFIHESLY